MVGTKRCDQRKGKESSAENECEVEIKGDGIRQQETKTGDVSNAVKRDACGE